MMVKLFFISILMVSVYIHLSQSGYLPRTSVLSLKDRLLKKYRKDDRPVRNYYQTCYVHLRWSPMSMYNFDEVSGVMSMTSSFILHWYDAFLTWSTGRNGLPDDIAVNKHLVWIPELGTFNSAETNLVDKIDNMKETARVRKNGQVYFRSPAKVLKTLCTPNMEFYPVEEHTCVQQVFIKGYYPHEVQFGRGSKLLLDHYQTSSTWDVKEWKFSRGTILANSASSITLTVVFKRKPVFILLNMILPVLLLSVINVFVFGLPVMSGERISYAMTSFLSLAVYMTIIAEKLPDGNPVPLFTYFIIGKLVYSSLIILCTIIGIQLHHGKESVLIRKCQSLWLSLKKLKCTGLKNIYQKSKGHSISTRKKITTIHVATVNDSPMGKEKSLNEDEELSMKKEEDRQFSDKCSEIKETSQEKWKSVAKTFDRVCLVVFLLIVMSEIATWVVVTWFH